jgi:Tol biopolymer transport system component
MPKPRLVGALVAVVVTLALPAAAGATLAYNKNIFDQHVWVAEDNGTNAHEIGVGFAPHVSPDGESVVYETQGKGHVPQMELYSLATKKKTMLLDRWRETITFAWSPDSTMVAALAGGELGKRTLYVVNVETSKLTRIATGYFAGVSFSPDSTELVFGLGAAQSYFPAKTDIVRAPVTGGATSPLTHDHISAWPLWGPRRIVFVKQLSAKQRRYGPKNELFLMNADGKQVKRLTHTKVDPLTEGLFPTAWSASGKQLLAEYEGQDTSYAVAVNPKTGAEKSLSPRNTETGFVATALSADGKTALGYLGGYEGPGAGAKLKIVSVPYSGGKAKVLVKGGFNPSWGG